MQNIRVRASQAIKEGVNILILSDRGVDKHNAPIPALLAVSGLHHHLIREGTRTRVGLVLESGEPRARLAIDYFVYRVAREIGSLAAALGGLDGLVFTAGIGENSAEIRAGIVERCAWLGMEIDEQANGAPDVSARITKTGSKTSAWVIATNEELMIARHTCAVCKIK
jgi:acetate kinase